MRCRNVKGVLLLFVEVDAEGAHLFLYGRQHCHHSGQGLLVLGHDATDVLDVILHLLVVLGGALDMLQADVEQSQRARDGVQLGNRQQLDLGASRLLVRRHGRTSGPIGAGPPTHAHTPAQSLAQTAVFLRGRGWDEVATVIIVVLVF